MPKDIFSPRQVLVYVAVGGLLFLADPDVWTYVAGCTLAALGILMRAWGCGHLHKNKELTTSGPYAHVKHPLYLGTFLVAAGGILAAGSRQTPSLLIWVALGPLFLGAFLFYYMPKKKQIEGGRLAVRFGAAYEEWDRAVPHLVPSLKAYTGGSGASWSWRTYRNNSELEMDVLIVALFAAIPVAAGLLHG